MSDISLTASMRSNLLSLQNTSKLMDQTQERLSTGKKVNSAIDNPSSYYTARSLNNRAGDLSSLLDSMGQGISTIKAANEGIESITSFVEQAKAVASNALEAKDGNARKAYMDQFNTIRTQIDQLATDSGYKGVNLLGGTNVSLTITFNEDRSSQLTIKGVDASTTGLSINEAAWGGTAIPAPDAAHTLAADNKTAATTVIAKGEYFKAADGSYYRALSKIDSSGENPEIPVGTVIDLSAHEKMVKVDNSYYDFTNDTVETAIQDSITAALEAINTLRNDSSEFGNNYAIVQARENFTTNLINVLEEGADKLILADMNEESANMLALQTRQQLAINSLSLASQAAQSVLRLFS